MTHAPAPARQPPRPPFPLREAHCHIGALGEALSLPSLANCQSLHQCLAILAELSASASKGEPIRVLHARPLSWPERRWPTLAELDAVTPDHPLVLMSFDHHEGVANSAMLGLAGLSPGQKVGPNGLVAHDDQGHPTGLLIEHALYAAWDAATGAHPRQHDHDHSPTRIDPRGADRAARAVRAALQHLAKLGYSQVHDLRTNLLLAQTLIAMDLSGELDFAPDLRIELFPLVSDLTAVRHLIQTLSPARVHLAGGKLFADGTLNARTALTINPYADPLPNSPCGVAMVTPRELDDAIRACDALGLPLAVHAIGDGAVRMVLDAHQRVRPRALGQRIEHAELIDPADVPRFAQLAITASLQPCHLLTDVPALTTLLPHALDRVMPIKALIDSGLTPGALVRGVIFGSDAPIVRADPGDSIAGATRGAASNPGAPLVPGLETLSPDQAIDERTAWSCFQVNATPQPTLSP